MTATATEPADAPSATGGIRGLSPRQRRRVLRGIQYAIFLAVIVLIVLVVDWHQIREHFLDAEVAKGMLPELLTVALRNTIIYTLCAYVFGFVIGLLIALMRLSSAAPYRWV